MTNRESNKEAEPVGWQHRVFYDDTNAWSEWMYGKYPNLYVNDFEERPLFTSPQQETEGREITEEMVERASEAFWANIEEIRVTGTIVGLENGIRAAITAALRA